MPLYIKRATTYICRTRISAYNMSQSLQDSGGHYYDGDTGGITGIARRNVAAARSEITSGSAGAAAIGTAVGFIAAGAVKSWRGN